MPKPIKATFFKDAPAFRRWLEANHADAQELQVGFYRRESGRGGLTKAEAIDEALCFGWIDGVIHKLDADSYCHRFTPRRPDSIWSKVNLANVRRLQAAGRMQPAGLAAFAARDQVGVYSFERKQAVELAPDLQRRFEAARSAWDFFRAQAPSYQRVKRFWVMEAKQPLTRERRLDRLIAESAAGRRFL